MQKFIIGIWLFFPQKGIQQWRAIRISIPRERGACFHNDTKTCGEVQAWGRVTSILWEGVQAEEGPSSLCKGSWFSGLPPSWPGRERISGPECVGTSRASLFLCSRDNRMTGRSISWHIKGQQFSCHFKHQEALDQPWKLYPVSVLCSAPVTPCTIGCSREEGKGNGESAYLSFFGCGVMAALLTARRKQLPLFSYNYLTPDYCAVNEVWAPQCVLFTIFFFHISLVPQSLIPALQSFWGNQFAFTSLFIC